MSVPPTPLAIVYVHAEQEGPVHLERALRGAGFTVETRFRAVAAGDVEASLLVVMGGPMAAYEASRFPFLQAELDVLRARLRAGRPSLGICLGAQLLATAAGARVFRGASGPEIGVGPVTLLPSAATDPALSGLPSRFPVVHWHGDTFDAVSGAVGLLSTERYPAQGFRLDASYGFQFHPELGANEFRDWVSLEADALAEQEIDPAALLAHGAPALVEAEPVLERFRQQLAEALARAAGLQLGGG